MRAQLFMAILLVTGAAQAQDLSTLTGTISVTADSLMSGGELAGCALEYQASTQDHRYKGGNLVMVAGSFNLNYFERDGKQSFGIVFKMGLKDLVLNRETPIQPPAFGYMFSKNGTTAKSIFNSALSDTPGFRTFLVKLDDQSAALLGDILTGGPVSVAFSRKEGGMDVVLPLDLSVESSTFVPNVGFQAKRSEKNVREFSECFQKLAAKIKR